MRKNPETGSAPQETHDMKKEAAQDLDQEQLEKAADAAREIAKEKELQKYVGDVAAWIDDTKAMDAVRKIWDKVPEAGQWALLHGPVFPGDPLKSLVKSGLLEYKRAPTEKDLKDMAATEKKALEWTVKYGKYLQPELAALEPAVEPIKQVMDAKEGFFAGVRGRVKTTRKEREDHDRADKIRGDLAA